MSMMTPEILQKGSKGMEMPTPPPPTIPLSVFVFPTSQWVKPWPPSHAACPCPQIFPMLESLPSGNICHEISGPLAIPRALPRLVPSFLSGSSMRSTQMATAFLKGFIPACSQQVAEPGLKLLSPASNLRLFSSTPSFWEAKGKTHHFGRVGAVPWL